MFTKELFSTTKSMSFSICPYFISKTCKINYLFQFTFWKYTNDFFKFLFSFKNMYIISLFLLSYMFIAISEFPIYLYFFLLNV